MGFLSGPNLDWQSQDSFSQSGFFCQSKFLSGKRSIRIWILEWQAKGLVGFTSTCEGR
jgi:hypothetical protein